MYFHILKMQMRSECELRENKNTILLCFSGSKRDASAGIGKIPRFSGTDVKSMDLADLSTHRALSPPCITER